jgi:hypothetical protein
MSMELRYSATEPSRSRHTLQQGNVTCRPRDPPEPTPSPQVHLLSTTTDGFEARAGARHSVLVN